MFFEPHAESDATNLWYTEMDVKLMKWLHKRNIIDTHKRLSESSLEECAEDLDVFGIESLLTPRLIEKKLENRRQHWDAVMEEQTRQAHSNKNDPSRLARVAMKNSEWAVGRASVIGILQSKI